MLAPAAAAVRKHSIAYCSLRIVTTSSEGESDAVPKSAVSKTNYTVGSDRKTFFLKPETVGSDRMIVGSDRKTFYLNPRTVGSDHKTVGSVRKTFYLNPKTVGSDRSRRRTALNTSHQHYHPHTSGTVLYSPARLRTADW